MYQKILKLLENEESPLSAEAISEKTKESLMKTKSLLLRLQEEGKVESTKKDDMIVWQIKKKDDTEKKYEKMVR
ncbi:MAG: ArsR family transcriptional regulator [Candidatus Methanofastidiosum sp.]|nr:ArsR family transcriptional regulator [Methanofastidiosum sp.]NYT04705.1 ArsR family transcriptional regulator [Candidatus Methanofastidiosa archaeon]NYT13134.1 ArsR family transcriptional regulator [Candidatus Methanofastidiosa archaeon]